MATSLFTNNKKLSWRMMTTPKKNEVRKLMLDLNIPENFLNELSEPTPQPICTNIGNNTYAIFHFPVKVKNHESEEEVDILISNNTLTSITYNNLNIYNLDVEEILDDDNLKSAAEIWWKILTRIYDQIGKEVDDLMLQIKNIREKVYTKKEHIKQISDIHRRYLAINLPISNHGEIITSIHKAEHPGHGITSPQTWNKVRGEYHRLITKIERLGAYANELRDTQNTLISERQNSLVQKFTALAFLFLPINFFAALFGMNVTYMPIVTHPNGFWILTGLFFIIAFFMLIFFKIRKWL